MTQKETVLEHLRTHGTITSWEAIQKYRITRLSAIIGFLKDDGHKIDSEPKRSTEGKSYSEYSMPELRLF